MTSRNSEATLREHTRNGMTLVELTVVLAIIGAVMAMAIPNMRSWSEDQRVKTAARSISDAFLLARSEAIRTGNNHLVIFGGALTATAPIEIVNDGPQATANCTIDPGETVHQVAAEVGVSWGTSTGAANGSVAPDDSGNAAGNVANGWSFTNAGGATPASWILFQSDGLPRTFTQGPNCAAIGNAGAGGGGIYVSSGKRDYAVVLRPLGTSRVHKWHPTASAWSN